PVDERTIEYLRLTGRSADRVELVETYCKQNQLWHDPADGEPTYTQVVELDLSTVEPSLAGPRRPQDRVPLADAKQSFLAQLPTFGVDYGNAHDSAVAESFPASDPISEQAPGHEAIEVAGQVDVDSAVAVVERPEGVPVEMAGEQFQLEHGSVVIAAITSRTNTSNP